MGFLEWRKSRSAVKNASIQFSYLANPKFKHLSPTVYSYKGVEFEVPAGTGRLIAFFYAKYLLWAKSHGVEPGDILS